jgi:cobalt/nickel transport system permease protein
LALIFAFSYVRDLRLLPAMLSVSAVLYAASGLPVRWLLARLRYPGVFLLIVAILLPFLSGPTVLARVGPVALRLEGCLEVLRIVVKFVSILTVGLVLFGTAPFLTAIKAMRALGLPPILADMTLLAFRYLFEIGGDLARMQTAMRLRGFRAQGRSARSRATWGVQNLAALVGSLLVRSYERSDRVYRAMILRGYGEGEGGAPDEFEAGHPDALLLVGLLLVAAAFAVAEALLRRGGV